MILTPYLLKSLDMLAIGACGYDASHRALFWNKTFLSLFPEHDGHIHPGEPYAENLRRFYRLRLSDDERPEMERYVAEGVARHENQTQPFEFTHRGRRVKASSLRAPCGGRLRLWHVVEAPELSEQRDGAGLPAFDALRFIPDGAAILDADDRIIAANDAFRRLYDVPDARPVVGLTLDEVIAEAWAAASAVGALRATIRNGMRYDGAPFEVELPGDRWRRVVAQRTVDGIGYFVHADISAGKRQQAELLRMQDALRRANVELSALAQTDTLTGLANRRRLMEAMTIATAQAQTVTLIVIDVDHFKSVNDQHGHLAGDVCLRMIGQIVSDQITPKGGLVARLGGEEFGALLPGLDEQAAQRLAEGIRTALAQAPWRAVDPRFEGATVSIGVCSALAPLDSRRLYAGADAALYVAKRNGRNRVEAGALPASEERLVG